MIDKELLQLIGKNKKYLVLAVFLMILGMLANIVITGSICATIYYFMEYQSFNNMFIYALIAFLGGVIIRLITTIVIEGVKDKLGKKVKKDLRNNAYEKILKLGLRSSKDLSTAGLTQTTMEGIEQLDLYYSSYIPQFFFSMIAPLILFAICIGIERRVALLLLCAVPLIPLSIVAFSKYAKRIFKKYWGIYISMGDTFLDALQGLKELKIYQADEEYHKKINAKSEEFRKVTMKVLVMQLYSAAIMDFIAYGGSAVGIVLSILCVSYFDLHIVLALFLILVSVEFFLPLRRLGSAFHIAMNGLSAGKKLINLLKEEEPIWGENNVKSLDIKLDNVSFSYDKDKETLIDINIKFPKNGVIGIVGESGSGKSTIANIILGAIRPTKGSLLIDGKDISNYSRASYYSHIALVSYNSYIFNETIRNNFLIGKLDATDKEINDVLKKVNLDTFVKENGGLDKVIKEGAVNLSGGQRQRLALAINLLTDKDVYIFDEATSNIDIESEEIIMSNIYELSKTKLIILISHRLENVKKADFIYYLEEGKIKEKGKHNDLIFINGKYKNLYETQTNLAYGYKNINHSSLAEENI